MKKAGNVHFQKALLKLICLTLFGIIVLNGCAAEQEKGDEPLPEPQTVQIPPDAVKTVMGSGTVPTAAEETPPESIEPAPEITNAEFQKQLDTLVSTLTIDDSVTLHAVKEITPDLADMIETDYAAVSLLCLSDLLAPENNRLFRENINDALLSKEEPPERHRIECELFRCLVMNYEPSSSVVTRYSDKVYEWLAEYYRFDIMKQCREHGTDPSQPYYQEHPIHQQFLTAMLREPVWRMSNLTPLSSDLYDQDSYIDATNSFYMFLDYGKQEQGLSVEPEVTDRRPLCTETAVWTLTQSEDYVVTLEIVLETGDIVTLTYTPQ